MHAHHKQMINDVHARWHRTKMQNGKVSNRKFRCSANGVWLECNSLSDWTPRERNCASAPGACRAWHFNQIPQIFVLVFQLFSLHCVAISSYYWPFIDCIHLLQRRCREFAIDSSAIRTPAAVWPIPFDVISVYGFSVWRLYHLPVHTHCALYAILFSDWNRIVRCFD